MDGSTFDTMAKLFAANRVSRRMAIAGTGLGIAAAAQDASPEASPVAPDAEHGPEMLFIQSFQSGSIVPRDDVAGRYTVTLEQGLGETIYFSDRPDRIAGSAPTETFLDGLGFSDDNPPNAAILTTNAEGNTTLAIVELFAPVYDAATAGVTYDIEILDHWKDEAELGFSETPVDLDALGATFGTTHLFIDDCADANITCVDRDTGNYYGGISYTEFDGWCYSWQAWHCLPCQPWTPSWDDAAAHWDSTCAARFPFCGWQGICWADKFH